VAGSDRSLFVRAGLVVPSEQVRERFTTSGGPGGQHANRAHTRVEVWVELDELEVLSEAQRRRLHERYGDRVTASADEERSQARNRRLARDRLAARLRAGLATARSRTPTRPTAGSRRRRVEAKKQRGDLKRQRRTPPHDD
jgi:ribosome-associated protein